MSLTGVGIGRGGGGAVWPFWTEFCNFFFGGRNFLRVWGEFGVGVWEFKLF